MTTSPLNRFVSTDPAEREALRWRIVVSYFFAVLAVFVIAAMAKPDSSAVFFLMLIVVFGGNLLLQLVYHLPAFKRVPLGIADPSPVGVEEVVMIWTPFKISAGVLFLLSLPLIYWDILEGGFGRLQIIAGLTIISLIVLIPFGRIRARADRTGLSVRVGPIRSMTPLTDIESIETVSVQPLREFKGWGFRFGQNKTRGYLADLKTGFKFTRTDGRAIVVTVQEPQRFVDYVTWTKSLTHPESDSSTPL